MRARGAVAAALRVAIAGGARLAVGVEQALELAAAEARAVHEQLAPRGRPGEVGHRLARQAEREVEAADPRPGTAQEGLERGERAERLDLLEVQHVPCGDSRGD